MRARSAIACRMNYGITCGLYAASSAICMGTAIGSASLGTAGGSSRLKPFTHLCIWRLEVFGAQ